MNIIMTSSYKRSAALGQFVIHRGLIISTMQAVFCSVFYFASIALFPGFLMVGWVFISIIHRIVVLSWVYILFWWWNILNMSFKRFLRLGKSIELPHHYPDLLQCLETLFVKVIAKSDYSHISNFDLPDRFQIINFYCNFTYRLLWFKQLMCSTISNTCLYYNKLLSFFVGTEWNLCISADKNILVFCISDIPRCTPCIQCFH